MERRDSLNKCQNLPWEWVGWVPSAAHFLGLKSQAFQRSGNQQTLTLAPLQGQEEVKEPCPALFREAKISVLVEKLFGSEGILH